ncbi:putative glycoside hydrolase family 3 protein [Diaporthe ampelina]|uniref:Beta-glucosidase cel3A n=1 Tax=Diaporthe ampelina TaxID=1214573 RepID=A0A0G2HM48_9PEZI|nr:putative glycoside hydrolase family 3 protein [Diaporthe ampelina]
MLLDLCLAATLGLSMTSPVVAQAFDWSAAYTKANAALAKLSLQDKVNIVTGVGWDKGPCVGNTQAISSISYPQLCLQDSPLGIRFGKVSTAFTPGIQAASTWDIDLIRQRGQFMGAEAKAAGVHVQLGPVAGPLGKIAQGGRNWEGFGPDPYLTGIAMAETIQGMQGSGVQATAKHYILNEQEKNRETMSSRVDDRSMHELYLWPFADSVKAGVATVMCSYNKINGTWACENDNALNKLLKQELGFQGYIMTDWNAQHSTVQAANMGLDMTMPGSDFNGGTILWGPELTKAVNNGQVAQTRVDDMVKRILAAWYLVGQDVGYPPINIQANVQGDHKSNVRAVARDGIVLLKNTGSVLPLKKPTKLALVGSAAVVNPSAPYDALKTRTSADGTTLSAVATANKNTIVVVQSVGPVILEDILALDGVKAVVWAGLGSQESGNALVDILYGSTNPSGKLPYTIAKSATDYGTAVTSGDDSFPEGLYIDYRHFDQAGIAPRYEFGYGLFTNSGSVGGAEVPQLYLTLPSGAPAAPPKQLRGFTKLSLQPGASGTATFNLRRRDLSYWDVASQNWVVPGGNFGVSVGASSRDVRLTGSITVS